MSAFQYLDRQTKQLVRQVDEADMDALLAKGLFSVYVKLHDALADLIKDGADHPNDVPPMSADRMQAFMHPYKKWGKQAPWQLNKLRKLPDSLQSVPIRAKGNAEALAQVDGDTLELLVAAGEMAVAENIYKTISISGINSWTDGQRQYMELYDAVLAG